MNSFSKATSIVLIIFFVVFIGIAGKVVAQKVTAAPNTPPIHDALRLAAKAVNDTAPQQIDKNTTLMNAVVLEKTLRYRYTLLNVLSRDFEKGSLSKLNAERMKNNVCTTEGMKILVRLRAVLEFAYYDKNGVELEIVSIDTARCG